MYSLCNSARTARNRVLKSVHSTRKVGTNLVDHVNLLLFKPKVSEYNFVIQLLLIKIVINNKVIISVLPKTVRVPFVK